MLSTLFKEILNGWVDATQEQFTEHPLAIRLRIDLKQEMLRVLAHQNISYKVKASAGAGNWANVPWLSILDPEHTTTTQSGIYPVYLFRSDGSGLYLSLGFGVTQLIEMYGRNEAKNKAQQIALELQANFPDLNSWRLDEIDLRATTNLAQSYEWASAGAIYYDRENIPTDDALVSDLNKILSIYSDIPSDFFDRNTNEAEVDIEVNRNMDDNPRLPKPFILLAGISGTGKTRFVREQARASNPNGNNFCLVPVRPDWHEPSDLLGYVSRISGKPEYVMTKVLRFIIDAWRVSAPLANKEGTGELARPEPYWLCLDEMNLAPVEQYFSDYLSVLETRDFNDGKYSCEALLDTSVLYDLSQGNGTVQKDLGLENDEALWQYFLHHGVSIPPNLIVAGTVNMDETTHGFSRKVIDRALTIDFGEFFPNDYDHFFNADIKPKIFSYSSLVQVSKENLSETFDHDGQLSIAFLKAVNEVLGKTPFELAYRALNELLLQVVCFKPESKKELQAVWDDFLMTKVLPRIDGDSDKLRYITGEDDVTLLTALSGLLERQLDEIWNETRRDWYREKVGGAVIDDVACRSKEKLTWMQRKLEQNTFTSFWP